jgi:hypothetical protein
MRALKMIVEGVVFALALTLIVVIFIALGA